MTAIDPSQIGGIKSPPEVDPQHIGGIKGLAPTPAPKQVDVSAIGGVRGPAQVQPQHAPQPQNPTPKNPGGIYGVNPAVNVMGDFGTNLTQFNTPGIRPQFRSIVQRLASMGNSMGVYDFNRGHHFAPNDPHLDGRAMDVDTINGESIGTKWTPKIGMFVTQALSLDPRVRVGVPQELYDKMNGKSLGGRMFVDAPNHVHVELSPLGMQGYTKPPAAKPPPNLAKPQQAGIGQAIMSAAQHVEDTGKGFFKELHYEQGHPLEAYSDLEGVFQRAVTGYLSQADPHGTAIITPPTTKAIGMAIYDAFHPHSTAVQNRDTSTAIRELFTPLGIPEAKKNTWAYFGQAIAGQSATDPVALLAPIMRAGEGITVGMKIARAAEGVPGISDIVAGKQAVLGKLANHAVSQFVSNVAGIRPELNALLSPEAKGARMMIEHSANAMMDPVRVSDETMLREVEPELRNLKPDADGVVHLPDAVRQRYLQEPYVYGTPQMRAQAVKLGYHPTDAEAAVPPRGMLNYNLAKDYQTLIKPTGESAKDVIARVSGGRAVGEQKIGFDQERTGAGEMGDNQYDITKNRLAIGRNAIRRRIVDAQTQQYLDQHGGWIGKGAADVGQLSDRAWRISTPLGKWFAKLGTESIKAFPLPHGLGNVGQLAWNKGGWTAVGLGLKHAVAGLKPEQVDRLKHLGLWAEYLGKDPESPLRNLPVVGATTDKLVDYSSHVLNRLEGGFRQALLDLADHQHGFDPSNLQNEYKKAKDVMDAIGDYANVSKVVAALSGIMGAPFVAFGLSIVPKALWKAMKEHPERIAGNARMMEDLENQRGGPLAPGVKIGGGPNESFMRMVLDPVGYMESPSRLGPAGVPIQVSERLRHGEAVDPAQIGGEALQSYGGAPGNIAAGLFGLNYPGPGMERGKLDLRAALFDWMTGRYIGKQRSPKSEHYFDVEEETGHPPKHYRTPRF